MRVIILSEKVRKENKLENKAYLVDRVLSGGNISIVDGERTVLLLDGEFRNAKKTIGN
ncbi:hypothetical protein [Vibrio phage vB_VpaP_SJSY21]|nr:hypothetical protein [Vibrio phage vB_VpaP_SJSY21]